MVSRNHRNADICTVIVYMGMGKQDSLGNDLDGNGSDVRDLLGNGLDANSS